MTVDVLEDSAAKLMSPAVTIHYLTLDDDIVDVMFLSLGIGKVVDFFDEFFHQAHESWQFDYCDFANVEIWTSRHIHTSESKSTSVHE